MKSAKMPVCLVVDDDKDFRESLVELLRIGSIEAVPAADAEEALRHLHENREILFVITDVKMPKTSGIELARCIRSLGMDLPIIFCSGYTDKEMAIDALRINAIEFLEKPFKLDQLFSAVKRALNQAVKKQAA